MQSKPAAIRILREAKGHSQSSLAREAGVSQPTVARLEDGPAETYPPTVKKLADALGVPIAAIATSDVPEAVAS
jgi:transcriptional regulator with XRE-family HTH domain